jgi:hypothetical protein
MLRLITAHHWIRETFPEGGVGLRTVEAWIKSGAIHGRIIDGKIFVEPNKTALLLDLHTVLLPQQTDSRVSSTNDLVDQIVAGARLS